MNDPILENGMAKVEAGLFLAASTQPVATLGMAKAKGLGGFITPDRVSLRQVETTGDSFFASADAPFLTALPILPDTVMGAVSAKVLVAPYASRVKGRLLKLVPLSFARSLPVTLLQKGWVVLATKSRVTRRVLEDGATLTVRPDALVAWIGKDPSGFCPKLGMLDILLPRGPRSLFFTFHGPATVWFEGAEKPVWRRPRGVRA